MPDAAEDWAEDWAGDAVGELVGEVDAAGDAVGELTGEVDAAGDADVLGEGERGWAAVTMAPLSGAVRRPTRHSLAMAP
ncbi:hypothetical protein DDQ41_01595 [Streptomyces spongiicola]|uniref:Uncharacterized protein n=1 Tax=Streptomyces spongiicola TaxID=1690221 RepID=A0ABN5KMQ6_9ACTN|nr:hypothetical protein DDQ41_01595 [Streptomyces spongiicola]